VTIDFDTAHYDRDADVLYLGVGDPARAVEFDELPEGHALRYDASGELVGITIVGVRRLLGEQHDVLVRISAQQRRAAALRRLTELSEEIGYW